MLVLCKLCSIDVEFVTINQFAGDHTQDSYIEVNPTQQIPTLVDNRFLVLGSTSVFVKYLVNSKQNKLVSKYWPVKQRVLLD